MKKTKLYFGKAIAGVLLGATAIALMAGCSGKALSQDDITETHPLLKQEVISQELESQDSFSRLPSSVNSPSTNVNINFETNAHQKEILEFCVQEYNDVFDFVNDKYNFELNYDANKKEKDDPFAINVGVGALESGISISSSEVHDFAPNIDGNENYNNKIILDQKTIDNDQMFIHVFKNEFAKILGLENQNSIEENNINKSCLSQQDITTLYSLYRAPEKSYDKTSLHEFLSNHQGYDYESLFAKQITSSLSDKATVLRQKLQDNTNYSLKDLKNLCEKIASGDFDKDFGETQTYFISKVDKLDHFIPYYHTSFVDGKMTKNKFHLGQKLEPVVDKTQEISAFASNGIIVSQTENSTSLSFKVGNLILTLNGDAIQGNDYESLIKNSTAAVYSASEQDFASYSQALSEQCKEIYGQTLE